MNNQWIVTFSKIINSKTGLPVGPDHIHASVQREFYIPEAESGKPLFLHHYRGPFFIDIPQDDYERLATGQVSPEDYINSSQWMFGYYHGGASMTSGGYFRPLEDTPGINDRDKIYRFMHIIACEGNYRASGYTPTAERCQQCSVEKCPFSYHKGNRGNYARDVARPDGRVKLYRAINKLLMEFGNHRLRSFYFSDELKANEFLIRPCSFQKKAWDLYISASLVRELLYNPDDNWDFDNMAREMAMYIKGFSYRDGKRLIGSQKDLDAALDEFGIRKVWDKLKDF